MRRRLDVVASLIVPPQVLFLDEPTTGLDPRSRAGIWYRAYLVSGLFATIAANVVPSMVAVARDSTRGVVDRFRSLPITRSAVPFGQAAATAVYGLASFVLMALAAARYARPA